MAKKIPRYTRKKLHQQRLKEEQEAKERKALERETRYLLRQGKRVDRAMEGCGNG